MLHKNILAKSGLRLLDDTELETVSGGEIVVTAPRPYQFDWSDYVSRSFGDVGLSFLSQQSLVDGGGGAYPITIDLEDIPLVAEDPDNIAVSGFYDIDGDGEGDQIVVVSNLSHEAIRDLGTLAAWNVHILQAVAGGGASLGTFWPGTLVGLAVGNPVASEVLINAEWEGLIEIHNQPYSEENSPYVSGAVIPQ